MEWVTDKTIACTNCGIEAPTSQQGGNYIDDGWSIGHDFLGHYGGFSDNFPPDENGLAHLCHDCCVLMLNALPGLAKFLFPNGGGGHSSQFSDPPCCQYAWTVDKCACGGYVVYHGSPDGVWRRLGCERCDPEDSLS